MVAGFLNAWEMAGEEKFLDVALRYFDGIDKYFIDHKKDGWFAMLEGDGRVRMQSKCDCFICPYHNARMCLVIIERCRKHTA